VLSTSHAQQVGMVPGYASVDLACGVGSRHWDAELYVQNAFDRRADSARDALCVGGDCLQRLAQPIPPRLVGLTFSQRF
jgi:outer membrane receptor protein involved in Fe transport